MQTPTIIPFSTFSSKLPCLPFDQLKTKAFRLLFFKLSKGIPIGSCFNQPWPSIFYLFLLQLDSLGTLSPLHHITLHYITLVLFRLLDPENVVRPSCGDYSSSRLDVMMYVSNLERKASYEQGQASVQIKGYTLIIEVTTVLRDLIVTSAPLATRNSTVSWLALLPRAIISAARPCCRNCDRRCLTMMIYVSIAKRKGGLYDQAQAYVDITGYVHSHKSKSIKCLGTVSYSLISAPLATRNSLISLGLLHFAQPP
jgi:hypothetical protein